MHVTLTRNERRVGAALATIRRTSADAERRARGTFEAETKAEARRAFL